MEKLRYQAKTGTIIYRSKMHPVLKRNFEVFSACDWLAALAAHIPNAGEHLVRYYGWYSNVNRGKRRKVQGEEPTVVEDLNEVSTSVAKRAWARLIKQVYEVDPLICPRCAEEIAQQYPSLRLADVYAVIAFYLRRRSDVDSYLHERQRQANAVRAENEVRFDPSGVRDRLLARHADTGQ